MKITYNGGKIYGFLVKVTKTEGLFFQTDKNNQVCDIFSSVKGEGIKSRQRGKIFDTFKGRPYGKSLLESVYEFVKQEQEENEA